MTIHYDDETNSYWLEEDPISDLEAFKEWRDSITEGSIEEHKGEADYNQWLDECNRRYGPDENIE